MLWISSLWMSSPFWEGVEYVAEGLVVVGAVFEVLTDFEWILKGDSNKATRHRLAKCAAIVLVLGLGLEFGALVRTNALFSGEISVAHDAAKDASNQATSASGDAKDARDRAAKATSDAAAANLWASQNEKEAARLNKLAEDEESARAALQKQLAWREPTDAQLDRIRDKLMTFSGQQFDIVTYPSEPECLNLENRLYSVAIAGQWVLDPERKFSALFSLLDGVQVNVSEQSPKRTKDAASAFADSLSKEGVSTTVKVVPTSDNPPRTGLLVVDIGRNPASMTPVPLPQ